LFKVRLLALAAIPLAVAAAAAPPDLTPPPILKQYITHEEFSPPDFAWMRGAFPDATAAERTEYEAIQLWLEECARSAAEETRVKLAELGVEEPPLNAPVSYPVCEQVAAQPESEDYDDFEEFTSYHVTTRPIFDALVAATELAEANFLRRSGSLRDELHQRVIADQVYRNALSWAWSQTQRDGVPHLTPKQQPIFLALLRRELAVRDRANTEWLKAIVAEQGWPTVSQVGEDASARAWLLAQHADHDPVFQLQALKLMEPLIERGEVSAKNYAYLYDRVMLKLVGKQRYATQVYCKDGQRVPQPLENEEQMPEQREAVGLVSFEVYLTYFSSQCPAE
jgi:hypothetical protein